LLPNALYSAGVAKLRTAIHLSFYSDGISEAGEENEQELGEARLAQIISGSPDAAPEIVCDQIMEQVTAFASSEVPRTTARCWL